MNEHIQARLALLRSDYRAVTDEEFNHFYCPILFKDDDVPLCKGHIVNRAFRGVARKWTVQRKDVDNFFGTNFESDFSALEVATGWQDSRVFSDNTTYKKLSPKLRVGDREIDHFVSKCKIPEGFAAVEVRDGGTPLVIGLRMKQEELLAASESDWTFEISKDIRVPGLVSLIKAAHLTLFSLIGYRYVLSAAGRFVGNDILGKFFADSSGKDRQQIRRSAEAHFREFVHMLRPVQGPNAVFQGTIKDRKLLTCWGSSGVPWAMIVFIGTGAQLHAVMIPIFEHENSIDAFVSFMKNDQSSLIARMTTYDKDAVWRFENCNRRLHWPKTGLFDP